MIVFQVIHGLSVGLEYFDREVYGFGINLDLGFIRVTWYRDIRLTGEGDDEEVE